MNIEKFVEETLRSIRKGVTAAQAEPGLEINPSPFHGADNTAGGHIISQKTNTPILFIKFDLSVIVQAGQTEETGGRIKILGVGGGDEKLISKLDKTQIQRISFDIPITFFRPEDYGTLKRQ